MRDVNLTVWKQTRSLELRMPLSGILTVERDALLKEMRFFFFKLFPSTRFARTSDKGASGWVAGLPGDARSRFILAARDLARGLLSLYPEVTGYRDVQPPSICGILRAG